MKPPEEFTPSFKEKDNEQQYYYSNGEWIKCGEDRIDSLWHKWVVAKNASRDSDDEGFSIFGFTNE